MTGILRHIRNRPGIAVFSLLFMLVFLASRSRLHLPGSILLAFDVASFVFLALTFWTMSRAGVNAMEKRALEQKEGRLTVLLASMTVSIVSVIALNIELQSTQGTSAREMLLCAVSLLLAWSFFNTVFALHYAHVFHDQHFTTRKRPLSFPGTPLPRYWDFMYFAFVVGMTFQVSDVQVTSSATRKDVLMHGILAFVFNVMVIGMTVNLLASHK